LHQAVAIRIANEMGRGDLRGDAERERGGK